MSGLSNISEFFPYARFHADCRLITWHPTGILDNERADRIVSFLEHEEAPGAAAFNRFTDMNGYSRIKIGLDHIVRIARRRRSYAGPPVKSAFFATRTVSSLVARMYEELMDGSPIEVCTFRELAAAADWLGVPVETLHAPDPPPDSTPELP